MLEAVSGRNGRPPARELEVIIIGAGFGGVAAAIELRRHGIRSSGSSRRRATSAAPGTTTATPAAPATCPATCTRSPTHSAGTGRGCARLQDEIHSYLHDVARDHGIEPLIRTNTTVSSCWWDEQRCRWTVLDSEGKTYEADAIVLATGQLHQPSVPDLAGAEDFAGHSLPLGRMGPRLRPRGQARGGRRQRRERRPVRPRDRPAGRPAERLPAHRQLVPAAQEHGLSGLDEGRLRTCPGPAGLAADLRLLVHRVADSVHPQPAHVRDA